MTTLSEAREAIYQRWATNWGSTSAYCFENQGSSLQEGRTPWAMVFVRHNVSSQQTLGPTGYRRFRRFGSIYVQINTLIDTGLKANDDLAYQAKAVFEGTSFSGLACTDSTVREVGSDGKWYTQLVEVDFDYEETK